MTRGSLMQDMNLTAQEIRRRLKIVGFGPADQARVLAVGEIIIEHAEADTESFFAYLASQEDAGSLIRDAETTASARRLKTAHLRAMATGEYGPRYVEERLKLGMFYAVVGLDPRVFLGAYHHLMCVIAFRVMERYQARPLEGFDTFLSLQKVAFFDIGLIVDTIVFERERLIRQQQDAIRELSTPVLQVRDRLLILPIVGALDPARATQLTGNLLDAIRAHRAKIVVIDITGVPRVDATVAHHLMQTVQAVRLIGTRTIITGVSQRVAEALVGPGVDVAGLETMGDLQRGIEAAELMLARDGGRNGRRDLRR